MRLSGFNTRSALVLLFLILVATVLSVASYEYSNQVSANAANLSIDEIHSNTQIEASDLGHILENSLEGVSSNLIVIAYSHSVLTANTTNAVSLFNAAQNSTKSLTFTYFWLDQNGRLVLSSNGTSIIFPHGAGIDLSQRSYFTSARDNKATFFSSATPSINNASTEYVFVSRPIFREQNFSNRFSGVVGASIDLRTLGKSLESNLQPKFKSNIGLLDFKGGILYSGNDSLIGENVYGSAFQNAIPPDLKPKFNAFLNQSLSGQAGVEDLSYRGNSSTLAYQPVFVNATTLTGGKMRTQFGVLYVTAADSLAANAVGLIGQQQSVSLLIILGIAGISGGLAVITLRWNKRLNDAVKEKTSDLVSANEELAAKSKAEKDLMNITAHELRTPTQSILANTEILRRVIRPALGVQQLPQSRSAARDSLPEFDYLASDIQPSEMVEMVESTYRNVQRLQKLTQNILEVARIDNKTFHLDKETFGLNELVRQSVEDSQGLLNRLNADQHDIGISFEPKQDELLVNADRIKIGEVLNNLLDNSMKFSNNGTKIMVSTDRKDKDFAVVSVKDEGSGIDPEILPKLFSKFATKTGTGLGLYISKAYVEAHGGIISVESNKGKKGTVFSFTLPLASVSTSKQTQTVIV